jgi:hypothetical protein
MPEMNLFRLLVAQGLELGENFLCCHYKQL